MPTADALRLAQLHNHIDKMNHEVTTRGKVGAFTGSQAVLLFSDFVIVLRFTVRARTQHGQFGCNR